MDNLNKLKVYKANSLYADFLFSYPATHLFHNKISPNSIEWGEIFRTQKQEGILYVHIPFCYHICDFCNVYKEKVDYKIIDSYLERLFLEMEDVSFYTNKITRVYVGGGTPTLLNEHQLDDLLNRIHKNFNLSDDCYLEIDAFPSTLTFKKLSVLHKNNVKQISIGIQSMEAEVLTNVGRVGQNFKVVEKMIGNLKEFNFNLHFDFILGLPGEDIVEMRRNIEYIAENANPYSVSINSYDNTIDTKLYKDYGDFFKQKEYKKDLNKNMSEIEDMLELKYSITRKTTFYFSDFWRKNMNVIAIGAGAFGFVDGYGVYRNPLLLEYVNNGYEDKKSIEFTQEDYKVMFLIHNYHLGDISNRYKSQFSSEICDDFPDQINILESKGFIDRLDNTGILFKFGTSSIAYFHFIDFYPQHILNYYGELMGKI